MTGKWLLTTLAVLIAIGISAWGLYVRIAGASSEFLKTASPSLTYTVTVSGQKDRPRFLGVVHTVTFRATKLSEPNLVNEHLHSGDWLYPSFLTLYPEY